MRRNFSIVVLCALLMTLAVGCSKSPEERLRDHMSGVVNIVELNKESPDKAAQEIEAYLQTHKADLADIQDAINTKEASLTPEELQDHRKRMEGMFAKVVTEYMELAGDNVGLFENESFVKAMEPLEFVPATK